MLRLVGFLVIAYLGALGLLYVYQRSLIYHPNGVRPDPAASGVPEMMPVSLVTDDRVPLLAWWRPPVDALAPVLLFLHGNAGHLGYRGMKVRPYLDRGWGVLLLAWRGYSGNPGKPSEAGLYADGRAALAFLDRHGMAAGRTVYYGESLGAAVAVQLAVERRPAALVLEAPFTSLADAAAAHYPFFPVRPLVRDRFDSLAKIGRVGAPLLVVHGERDHVVPVRLGRQLLAAAAEPKEGLFPSAAGHNDLHEHGLAAAAIDFVSRHVRPPAPVHENQI